MQHLTNRFGRDVGEIRLAQRISQRHQRPGGRLIFFSIGGPLHFRQDACLLLARIRRLATSTCRNRERRQAVFIKALDQLAHSVSALESCLRGSPGKGLTRRDAKQHLGSPYHVQSFAAGFYQPSHFSFFLLAHCAQWMFLGLCH